jgi:hypothetical protein
LIDLADVSVYSPPFEGVPQVCIDAMMIVDELELDGGVSD